VTFDLIVAATQQGWMDQLIGAAETVSNNARIARLRETLAATAALDLPGVDAKVRQNPAAAAAGGMERMVRREGFADWGLWVDRMAAIGRCICSIQYPAGVEMGGGTGFLVADDLVLTNYHVVEHHYARTLDAAEIECRFDFAAGSAGAVTVKLDADWLVDHSPYSPHDPGDNGGLPTSITWTTRCCACSAPSAPTRWRVGRGDRSGSTAAPPCPRRGPSSSWASTRVCSPSSWPWARCWGERQRLAHPLRREHGAGIVGGSMHDMQLNVVALHHAGDPDYTKLVGDYNQGIPIGRILERMAARGVQKFWT
jgi:hypothetical protein